MGRGRCGELVSVCRAIPQSSRRSELSFSVHSAVASLPARERDKLLKRASAGRLGSRELRQLLSENGAAPSPRPEGLIRRRQPRRGSPGLYAVFSLELFS